MSQVQVSPWPPGKQAAISLTFDDGHVSNLEVAIPDLEKAGFRGAFYLNSESNASMALEWKAAHLRGHEMGNHTVTHPCRWDSPEPVPAWLKWKKKLLNQMTPDDIMHEVVDCADWLDRQIGPDPDRTFAYPCGEAHKTIGNPGDPIPYRDAILSRHRIARSANVVDGINRPGAIDPLSVDCYVAMQDTPGAAMIDYCARVLAAGGWGVITFHGIEYGHIAVKRSDLDLLLKWLAAEPKIWTAPMRNVGKHLLA